MTYIGFQSLNIAFVLSIFAAILFFSAGRQPFSRYIKSAERAVFASFALVLLASVALEVALFSRNFQVAYVANYSNRALTWFYTFSAFWAGQAGSLLFWCLLLAGSAVVVIVQTRKTHPELLPYAAGVLSVTMTFFLALLVFKSSPFELLPFVPQDGRGLNPLLQNPMMVFHPPTLYIGFVGFTVPFAFAIAALLTRRLDEQWLKSVRRWTLFSWLFLTIGNILGMQWAYVELGWGGYWAWDPVENSSLMPWLTGTAFLHSIIVQERKGVLKRWTISLIVITFALTIFGTFVTRSGMISSVHAFGVSDLGPLFLGFLALIIITSTLLLIRRTPMLQGKEDIGTWSSKESSFLLNNILFVAITIGVFVGVVMPTLSELISGQPMTVGQQFFNRMATPIGIAIFLLIGVCTVLSWGKTSTTKLWRNLWVPLLVTLVALGMFLLSGLHGFTPLLSLSVAVFALMSTIQDYLRSARVHSRQQQTNVFKSIIALARKHKRRYGGYIVHIGVLLFFLGLIGSSAFPIETSATVRQGETIEVGDYQLAFEGIERERAKDRFIDSAIFNVQKGGKDVGTIVSEKHLFENFQPATEVGLRSTLKEDVYVILADYDQTANIATVSVLVNPLVLWIWLGGIVMVLGSVIAIYPDKKGKAL